MLLGIDIGTSSCKAAVFGEDGGVLARQTEKYAVYYPGQGCAEQNPEEWWNGVCTALKKLFAESGLNPAGLVAVGIDGQSWSAIPIDKSGNLLANTPIWMDTRAEDVCRELDERIGSDCVFKVGGNPLKPTYSLPKILWLKKHNRPLYDSTYKFLQSNGYIVYKLTGRITMDKSQCYGFQSFNLRTGRFDSELSREMGLDTALLPEIAPCHEVVGYVTKQAAAQCGLREGTPVVAGGLDAACSTLGAGVVNRGQTQEQGGQSGGMSICMDTYADDPRLITGIHVVPGRWLLQGGTVGGGSVLNWFRESFCDNLNFAEIDREAAEIAPGAEGIVFLPYMAGERSPIWDSRAKGVFYGLDYSKNRAHFMRAVLEGAAFSLKHNLDAAEEAGAYADELRATGGSSNSILWTQIKSDITGKKIAVPSTDTTAALGAAMLAGVAAGVYKDFDDAVERTVKLTRFHEPDSCAHEHYAETYVAYLRLYECLAELWKGDAY